MADKRKAWTETQRKRFESSGAIDFILSVVNGDLKISTQADKIRLDSSFKLLAKTVPDLKAVEHSVDGDLNINVIRYSDTE